MALAALRPALFVTMLAGLSGGCTSPPASTDDPMAPSDAHASTSTPRMEPAPTPDPVPPSKTDMIAIGQGFTMQPGGQATLPDGSALRYISVREDSRCPPGKQCIWAGDAVVAFEWAGSEVILHTGIEPRSHVRDGLSLGLESLAHGDAPEAQLRVVAAE